MTVPPRGTRTSRAGQRKRLVPPPTARPAASVPSRTGASRRTGLLLAAAVLATIALFWMLPGWAERLREPAPIASEGISAPETAPAVTPPRGAIVRERESLTAGLAARRLLARADSLRDELGLRSPGMWAADELARADALLAEGRAFLDGDRPERALPALESAVAGFESIERGSGEASSRALADARRGIDSLDATMAAVALERAGAISPGSAEVAHLERRLAVLPRVNEQLERARVAEREERWSAALEAHRRALDLDSETREARDGLARVRTRQANHEFRTALADATAALDATSVAAASAALDRARSLRPEADELGPLSERLARVATQRRAALLSAQGLELETLERWAEAGARHDEALELVPHLESALTGRARCSTWDSLTRRLDAHLARPHRLSTPDVLDEVRMLLAEAKSVKSPGPRHDQRVARLEAATRAAATRVIVTLESDDQTDVTVYRVGHLGTFRQHVLELRPGVYTVTGRRAGYRDVRHELVIEPGSAAPRLRVLCDERI